MQRQKPATLVLSTKLAAINNRTVALTGRMNHHLDG